MYKTYDELRHKEEHDLNKTCGETTLDPGCMFGGNDVILRLDEKTIKKYLNRNGKVRSHDTTK